MPRYLVPSSAFQLALELARAVVAGGLQLPQAERALRDSYPEMSPRAAKGYIGSYVAMRRGAKSFATTIAANAWKLYLEDTRLELRQDFRHSKTTYLSLVYPAIAKQ